jgi:hypothetical protein
MKPDALQKHISSTYFGLRLGIVVFAFALPVVLYLGGRIRRGLDLAPSISDYYFWGEGLMRDWFVGLLFAVAGFLYLYKGFSTLENVLLNVGGVFLAAVALIPCACEDSNGNVSLHGVAAVGFFLLMAFVVFKCAHDTLPLLEEKNPQQSDAFRRRYHVIAGLLVLSPVAAVVTSIWLRRFSSLTFFVETFAIYVFAAYWAVKSRELSLTQAEILALEKRAKPEPSRGVVKADAASV